MKITPTEIRFADPNIHNNNVFSGYFIGIDSQGAGAYLTIRSDGAPDGCCDVKLSFDWEVWDAVVEVVAKHRKEWSEFE